MSHHPRSAGFTLIELMIGVAIVGILAALAIPTFQSYVYKGRVTEAVTILNEIKSRQEAYRSRFGNYAAVSGNGEWSAATYTPTTVPGAQPVVWPSSAAWEEDQLRQRTAERQNPVWPRTLQSGDNAERILRRRSVRNVLSHTGQAGGIGFRRGQGADSRCGQRRLADQRICHELQTERRRPDLLRGRQGHFATLSAGRAGRALSGRHRRLGIGATAYPVQVQRLRDRVLRDWPVPSYRRTRFCCRTMAEPRRAFKRGSTYTS